MAKRLRTKPSSMPWKALGQWILKTGAVAAALTAIGVMWVTLGFPRIATSADIARLNATQAEIAVDLYERAVRDALIARATTKADPSTQVLVDRQLQDAQVKLKAAQDRKLELAR